MRQGWIGLAASCAMLAGCGGGQNVASAGDVLPSAPDWRGVATPADRARLRGWRGAWVNALAQVKPADVAAEPALFDPDRSLAEALPPTGTYRCRTFKLGARAGAGPQFSVYGWFPCRIDASAGKVVFSKTGGSQRPIGVIYADTDARGVFLGTMELGDERTPIDYGRDATRDMAGLVERIGARRWRMVLPYPRFESTLDVIELVPASG